LGGRILPGTTLFCVMMLYHALDICCIEYLGLLCQKKDKYPDIKGLEKGGGTRFDTNEDQNYTSGRRFTSKPLILLIE